ncbi:MAG: LicD family protein [Defluviitaleaceae bacterium]|nr:LicD family protein [Defluviitaleaceae bacterium]
MKKQPREIVISGEDLRKLQMIELDILKEVDRVCRKHDINYFLIYGTLLGAVRHKGFIPWDDDLDIGFLRKDYEKFCKIFQHEADTCKYFIQTWKTDKHYYWNYGKIRRLDTEYIRLGQEHMKYVTGIYIDIFPFDYLPLSNKASDDIIKYYNDNVKQGSSTDNLLQRDKCFISQKQMKPTIMQSRICKLFRKGAWSHTGKYHEKKFWLRILYHLMSLIPGRVYASMLEHWSTKYNNDTRYAKKHLHSFGYADAHHDDPRVDFSSDIFEEYIDIEFEGFYFKTIKEWHKFLTIHYGNYMEPPPIEKRCGVAPASKIDFG